MTRKMSSWFENNLDMIPVAPTAWNQSTHEMAKAMKCPLEETVFASWKYPLSENGNFLGMEIEVENCSLEMQAHPFLPSSIWSGIPDGSLRNDGMEFVSRAMPPKSLCAALCVMDNWLKLYAKDADSSWRTSIHVHCNVRGIDEHGLARFIVLYLMFENSLFNYAGAARKKSVFCVPLLESNITMEAITGLWKETLKGQGYHPQNLLEYWDKYSALGINQLAKYGTLEFRHMPGDRDIPKLFGWIHLINQLFEASQTISTEKLNDTILKINTLSHYGQFREEVFKEYSPLLSTPTFTDDLAQGVLRIKEHLFYTPIRNLVKPKNGASMFIAKVKAREERKKAAKKEQRVLSWLGEDHAKEISQPLTYQDFATQTMASPPTFTINLSVSPLEELSSVSPYDDPSNNQ